MSETYNFIPATAVKVISRNNLKLGCRKERPNNPIPVAKGYWQLSSAASCLFIGFLPSFHFILVQDQSIKLRIRAAMHTGIK